MTNIDINEQIERDERAMERIAGAFERIADTVESWYKRQYPVRTEVKDVTLTNLPSDEDLLKESQGATGEPLEEWLGSREREFLERESGTGSIKPDPDKP